MDKESVGELAIAIVNQGYLRVGRSAKKDLRSKTIFKAYFAKIVDNLVDNPVEKYVYY